MIVSKIFYWYHCTIVIRNFYIIISNFCGIFYLDCIYRLWLGRLGRLGNFWRLRCFGGLWRLWCFFFGNFWWLGRLWRLWWLGDFFFGNFWRLWCFFFWFWFWFLYNFFFFRTITRTFVRTIVRAIVRRFFISGSWWLCTFFIFYPQFFNIFSLYMK